MNEELLSTLEIDTIGEIMNISMGSAATAASTLLDNKVTITTPIVKIVPLEEFEIADLEPAIAVDIRYMGGITGNNILILRKQDMRTILSQMMQTEFPENFEVDEMAESAICELMNQMMGSSATVLSCFLGRTINISTPNTVPINELDEFKQKHFADQTALITIEFTLSIKDMMDSKFISVMKADLAKEIIDVSLNFDAGTDTEEFAAEVEAAKAAADPAPPASQQAPPAAPQGTPAQIPQQSAPYPPQQPAGYAPQQGMYSPQQPYPTTQQPAPGYGYPQAPAQVGEQPPVMVQNYSYNEFPSTPAPAEGQTNLDLIMSVPVVVTVELGRTKRKIKEILEFGQGTIVELDKQAGSQVDVIVNGQLIAHGDVVVVDDNFSIRITEILQSRDSLNDLML